MMCNLSITPESSHGMMYIFWIGKKILGNVDKLQIKIVFFFLLAMSEYRIPWMTKKIPLVDNWLESCSSDTLWWVVRNALNDYSLTTVHHPNRIPARCLLVVFKFRRLLYSSLITCPLIWMYDWETRGTETELTSVKRSNGCLK